MNFPLHKQNKEGTILQATSSFYSDDYAEKVCDLHLRSELWKDENGKVHEYYRLHSNRPHNIEMALRYTIFCPKCSTGILKQIGRCRNYYELGLYTCPSCDNYYKH